MKNAIGIVLICLLAWSCDDKDGGENRPDFDRQAMLSHYANNLIIPAYSSLQSGVSTLQNRINNFADAPSEPALAEARTAWINAYSSWQSANAYNFGPAGEAGIRKGLIEEIGVFPAAEAKIQAAIAANDHSFNSFDRDARGFLALEFLLFGKNQTTAEVLAAMQASDSRRAHVKAMAAHLKSKVDEVVGAWGAYSAEFVQKNGTDVGSSTSAMYNEFVRSFEAIKNFKVGLPAGKRPGQTQPEPQLVEAFYSGRSLDMIKLHLQAIENIYYGRGQNGTTGPGFRDYLSNVEGGTELIALTEAQLQQVKTALNAVPTTTAFATLVADKHPSVDALHTELQKHTRFFKSDMSSLLGIAITFSSGDGD